MKTFSLILLLSTGLALSVYAQSGIHQEITLSRQSMTVKEILEEMQAETDLDFSYRSTTFINQKIDLPSLQMKVNDVMKTIRKETGLQYKMLEEKIPDAPGPQTNHQRPPAPATPIFPAYSTATGSFAGVTASEFRYDF